MGCHEARNWLTTRRDHTDDQDQALVREHLEQCPVCRVFERRLDQVSVMPLSPEQREHSTISTERIMQAVEQQRRISRQLEDIRVQQKQRMTRQRSIVIPLLGFFLLALMLVPFALLGVLFLQPDAMATMPPVLSNLVYVLLMLVQYLQAISALTSKNSFALAASALLLVILMGMWLRLMRPPHRV